ncbi:MAG TPA: tryptophan 2,3-dioxygenase family protein [Nonomuraea sp.]|nr:tryptophan 2,3-dioxygenase family protein [Nonomuraea sp.]
MTSAVGTELTYSSYLELDQVLTAQRPRTPAHDEVLFIVVHQVHELWFKLLLHELAELQRHLEEGASGQALHTLRRSLAILRIVTDQMDVMDTLTPAQFAAFRGSLGTASGAQSAQFRELEAVLGRREPRMLQGHTGEARARVEAAMSRPAVFDSLLRHLAFQGYPIPGEVLSRDVTQPIEPSPAVQEVLVTVHRDDLVAAQICEALIDLDQLFHEWRYRHGRMVLRVIGTKSGTGGSSGIGHLQATLAARLWPDLWEVRSRW